MSVTPAAPIRSLSANREVLSTREAGGTLGVGSATTATSEFDVQRRVVITEV